jgi:hypothetical protein
LNEDNRIVLLKNNTLSFSSADLYEVFLENPAGFNLPSFKNYDDVLSEFRESNVLEALPYEFRLYPIIRN